MQKQSYSSNDRSNFVQILKRRNCAFLVFASSIAQLHKGIAIQGCQWCQVYLCRKGSVQDKYVFHMLGKNLTIFSNVGAWFTPFTDKYCTPSYE